MTTFVHFVRLIDRNNTPIKLFYINNLHHRIAIYWPHICPVYAINTLHAHGQPNNVRDKTTAKGISAEDCAQQSARAMEKDKSEVIIGKGLSGIAPLMKRLSPSLVFWVNRREFQ